MKQQRENKRKRVRKRRVTFRILDDKIITKIHEDVVAGKVAFHGSSSYYVTDLNSAPEAFS